MTSQWDASKYLTTSNVKEMKLKIGNDEFAVKVRNLSWSKKNQLVSQCIKWDSSGNTSFDGDSYVKECLKYMIVEAPWGPTTEVFLTQISSEFGAALEALVPKAFSQSQISVEEIKKDFGAS